MPRHITSQTTLDNLKREAKRWLKALQSADAAAHARLRRVFPDAPAQPTLRDVQHALARELGMPGWSAVKQRLDDSSPMRPFDVVADALVHAYGTGDAGSMRIVWQYFGHMRAWDGMKRYVRLDLGRAETPPDPADDRIDIEDARYLVARAHGSRSWAELEHAVMSAPRSRTAVQHPVTVQHGGDEGAAVHARSWEEVQAALHARTSVALHAHGQMTDAVLATLARFPQITRLDLSGSSAVTDDGLLHLAALPELRELSLSGCGITDRGMAALQHLHMLETLELGWTRVTDAGIAHLSGLQRLRRLDLSGTRSGDGAVRALAGAPVLADFRSGNALTNDGLALLHELPVFATWHGGETRMELLSSDALPNRLSLRGTFTDVGVAHLQRLDGLFALDLDSDRLAITGRALAPLARLPHLQWLGFDPDDAAMPYIAALPHLRFLMCQDTAAGDDGFVALSRSRSLEYIWGRRCHNLQRRGFLALSTMPRLAHLSVSCLNVDDEGIAALPEFPSLRELMPMDVPDAGYRHIARCPHIESLVLMYCRDTTDAATEHLTSMSTLRKYFASYTRITDRTPQLLGGIESLEDVTFDSCAGLTDGGIAELAKLPRLERLSLGGMRHVTPAVAAAFPERVRVRFSTINV